MNVTRYSNSIAVSKYVPKVIGDNGWSQAIINLYRRSNTDLTLNDIDVKDMVFHFDTASLTSADNTSADFLGSWSRRITSGEEKLWTISVSVLSQASTCFIPKEDWKDNAPAVLSENGTKGDSGLTIFSIVIYQRSDTVPQLPQIDAVYYYNNNTISNIEPWSLDVPEDNGLPVWASTAVASTVYSVDNPSDIIRHTEWNTPQVLVKDGKDGQDGQDGANGNGIAKIDYFYKRTTTDTAPDASDTDWDSTFMSALPTARYLWQKQVIDFTDTTMEDKTTVSLIAVYGETGLTGNGIASISYKYALSATETQPSESAFGDDMCIPTVEKKYLWQKETILYTDGDSKITTIIIGVNNKGDKGDQGFSIVATAIRNNQTEDYWNTYCAIGRNEVWNNTSSSRNGCRIGDLFTVEGTSTEGKAHIATFRSTTASGDLRGDCQSHIVADRGQTGLTGEAAKHFQLLASSQTYYRDRRSNANQPAITITTQVSGYTGTPTITVSKGTYSSGSLTIPYNNDYDSVTITATLTGATPQTLKLNVVDITKLYLYKGALAANPADVNIYGDHYFNTQDNIIKVYTTQWEDFSAENLADPTLISLILSNCQSDVLSTIEEGTVTSSYYGYFNTIISNLIKTTDIEATNLKIDSSNIQGSISLDNIDGGGIKLTSGSISATDAGGKLKWQLNGDGSATFIDAEISGELVAKSVTHDGLNTINEVATTPIGSSSSPYVFPKDCWQVDTNISAFRNNYLAGTVSYSGSSYRGYAVYNASFVYHPSSYTASSTLAVGNIISGSVSCNAGCSKDLFTRVKNEKAYPFWIKCNMSLGGNFNGIYTRIWGTNGIAVEDNEDKNSELIIFPNEYVTIHCHSSALWGEKTASGNISGRLSCGYNEATAPVLVFSDKTRENFGNDCTEELPYKTLGTYNLAIPCRYVLLNYIAQIQGKHSSYFLDYLYVDGNQASSIKKYSSTNSVIVDLGSKKTNFRVSWFTDTHTVHNDDGSTGISRVLSNFYRLAYVGMVEIDGNLVSAPLALTLNDTNKTQYQFKPNGWINNHHEYVLTLFNRTASFTKVRGITAYNYIKNTLQLDNTNYQLNIASMIALGGSGLVSGLTYMEVGPTSIIFHTADNTYTLTTVGDTDTTLRSVFDSIQLYLQPISQPTGIETRDIIPMKIGSSRFNIGTSSNKYQTGYFDTVYANINNTGTANLVYGAVFN